MAKRRMGIIALLLCFCLCLAPFHAQAASTSDAAEPISTAQKCSLTLFYRADGVGIPGVPVKLYRIADVSADCNYTLTAQFTASGLTLNGIQSAGEWNVIRSSLESYIYANQIDSLASAVSDSTGQARFTSLQPGLYLVLGSSVMYGETCCAYASSLVALPGLDGSGKWQYQVSVTPKPIILPPIEPDGELRFQVLKLWKGDDHRSDRPEAIEVEIFRNGASCETVLLSDDNHWSYSWTTKDVNAIWAVAERNIPDGYSVTVEERSTTFILTNTLIPDTPPSDIETPPGGSPNTGDSANIMLYTILMYLSGIVLVLLGITGNKKRV